MAVQKQEKDHTWLIVGLVTAIAVVGVFLLKQDETKHLKQSASTTPAAEAQVLSNRKDLNNDVLKSAE